MKLSFKLVPIALSVLMLGLNARADDRVSVSQDLSVASVDSSIQVVKDGVVQTWTVDFSKTSGEMYLDSKGYASYSFNHNSMCMSHDIGDLAAPYAFTIVAKDGSTRKITVAASTAEKPVHVGAVCPEPGHILELSLYSESSGLFPDDLKAQLTAQLQARTLQVSDNQKAVEMAKQNGLKDYYSYMECGRNPRVEKAEDLTMVA